MTETAPPKAIHIIFQQADFGPRNLEFVEVHDEEGKSIDVGTWAADGDYEQLTITADDITSSGPVHREPPTTMTDIPPLTIGYTNHKGIYAVRRVVPKTFEYRVSQWHGDEPQYLMIAFDIEKKAYRDFLVEDVVYLGPLRRRFLNITAENEFVLALAKVLAWSARSEHDGAKDADELWLNIPTSQNVYLDMAVQARLFARSQFMGGVVAS